MSLLEFLKILQMSNQYAVANLTLHQHIRKISKKHRITLISIPLILIGGFFKFTRTPKTNKNNLKK